MKKRFVVVTNVSTVEEDRAFKDTLNDAYPGIGWWHRLDEVWLIIDSKGRFDARRLRDIARGAFNSKKLLVLEISEDGDTWAGIGPSGAAKEMFAWLHNNWIGD